MSEEFAKFDAVVSKILSVSHDELQRREKEWKRKRQRAKQKRAKTSPASRASNDKD
jgi:hypothetical protein